MAHTLSIAKNTITFIPSVNREINQITTEFQGPHYCRPVKVETRGERANSRALKKYMGYTGLKERKRNKTKHKHPQKQKVQLNTKI